MNKEQFNNEKEHILTKLEEGYFLRLSSTRNLLVICDTESNPLDYYSIRIFNNLIDEKLIVNIGGRFILTHQNV